MFVSNYMPHPGGLEVMVWNLARGLAKRHELVLVTSAYAGKSGVSREDGFEVHRLPAAHFTERLDVPYPLPLGGGVRRALSAAAAADVVHAHGALYAQTLMARRVAHHAHAPLVLTEHVGWVEYSSPVVNAVQRLAWRTIGRGTLQRSSAVVTYNARVHDWLTRRHDAVAFIGNGVDLHRFSPRSDSDRCTLRGSFGLPQDGVIALFAGRDVAKKNLDAVLSARAEGVTLVLCGAERGVREEHVIDLGFVPYERMPDLFACADLMIHAATGEGFPLAVQESIASGVPVVLLWDAGYSRLLPKELVGACDRFDEIKPRVAELANNGIRRAALGAAGRRWAQGHWSWDATVSAYEDIYHDVLGNGRSN
jgi:glycosyltransferase involved in cell wall biosynthesis